jgi:hypothetical protein
MAEDTAANPVDLTLPNPNPLDETADPNDRILVPDPKIVSVGAADVPDSALDASLPLSPSFAGVASAGVGRRRLGRNGCIHNGWFKCGLFRKTVHQKITSERRDDCEGEKRLMVLLVPANKVAAYHACRVAEKPVEIKT